jgi:dTDP-glucose 4,6-dehydratase
MHRTYRHFLVTGGAGFMGRDFIRHLLEKKEVKKVICYDALTYAGKVENIEDFLSDTRLHFEKGNILNSTALKALIEEHQIDCIVHFAAESHVDRSIENPLEFVQTNVLGTVNLLECVKLYPKIHFHHISTDEVFGSLKEEGFFFETSPYQPNSPYSASKASSDHFVMAYAHTYGLKITMSHASNNFGPYQLEEKLIPKLITALCEKVTFPLYGTGKNVREWTYVEDHSFAIFCIIERGLIGQSYNVGSQNEKSNLELIELIVDKMAKKLEVEKTVLKSLIQTTQDRKGHDFRYAMNSDKIRALGWKPQVTLEDGLDRTISYYLEKKKVCL